MIVANAVAGLVSLFIFASAVFLACWAAAEAIIAVLGWIGAGS